MAKVVSWTRSHPLFWRYCRTFSTNLRFYECEERTDFDIVDIKKAILNHKPVTFTPLCINLNQTNFGRPFSSSQVEVYPYAQDSQGHVLKQEELENREDYEISTYSIQLDQLYPNAFETLRHVCEAGAVQVPVGFGRREFYPITALLLFLTQKGMLKHEKSLLTLNRDFSPVAERMSEGDISAILAVHLVSQLVGQSSSAYMVSRDTKDRGRWCPCGCLTEIRYGNTNFGTKELWYGKPDIMAFPYGGGSVSVLIQKNARGKLFNEVVAISDDEEGSNKLHEMDSIAQITVETITFSYFQKVFQRRQKIPESDIVSLIPTVALCAEEAHIYMYDTKYDICLKNRSPLPLWNEVNGTLNMHTLITLWMVFYHLSFRPSCPDNAVNLLKESCGFQERIGADKLEKIEKSMKMEKKTSVYMHK